MTGWDTLCSHCLIDPRRNPWSTECEACARYRKRTGSPRPLYLIERHAARRHHTSTTQP